jgi:hypothetical protein
MNDTGADETAGSHAATPAQGSGVSDTTVTLDPENPWLGLDSYTEATRAYFHGRDEEGAELARRVQRANLTVLFGQSGLGKTSLLRAGLVPRLRGEGYCPVYVRLDYAPDSPPPAEQIKRGVFRATREAGHWTRPGASVEGESLWEFLHKRDDLLRDATGKPLIPFLIFDQFEEIFTLGQADDAGRAKVREFIEDLADLVENRPPAALEKRMEEDEDLAGNFDFGRADYRVLITLREDYLANLESLKGTMPSITQNRMRLARMTGAQALAAVVKPGGKLVSTEVAEAIVRFVAGGSELANAEVEPSLLSLVCRELNTARHAQGRKEISADLLAGSRDTILTEFYERSVADQPEGVRRVIEDELLTESGYRESLAEERVLKSLAAAGAGPDALAALVNRRLLRIEERLDMRRVELTHDVLCGVVLASRNQRHTREAREAAERKLAEQRERETATHKALVRARLIATVCAVLLVLALVSAAFGFWSMHRARTAEAQAQASRANAEKLVSFLIEDFYADLAPTGQLPMLGQLASRTVAYYDSLPAGLQTPQTQINRAMALTREAAALDASGAADAASAKFDAAQAVFEKLRAAGHNGEDTTYGLALILNTKAANAFLSGIGQGKISDAVRAADLLRPLARAPDASRRVRQLYANALSFAAFTQPLDQQLTTFDEARKVLEGLGALDLTDLNAASLYADTADTEARTLLQLGQIDKAQKLEQQAYDLTLKILARQPGNLHAMANRVYTTGLLGTLASRRHDGTAAMAFARKSADAGEDEVRFNAADLNAWTRWAQGLAQVARMQYDQGEIAESIASWRKLMALEQDPRRPSSLAPNLFYGWGALAQRQALTGDSTGAAQSLEAEARDLVEVGARLPKGSVLHALSATRQQGDTADVQLAEGNAQSAFKNASAAVAELDALKIPADDLNAGASKNSSLATSLPIAASAAMRLGRYADAERFARRWQQLPPPSQSRADPGVQDSGARAMQAHALIMQGHAADARKLLQPALEWYRAQAQAGATATNFRRNYAYALYVSAISQRADAAGTKQRKADLDAADKQIAGASAQARQLSNMRHVSGLIAAARTASPR